MKILLAPSETKTTFVDCGIVDKNSFIFPDLFDMRMEVIKAFEHEFDNEILNKLTTKAMLRYDGVAFDAIDYKSLDLQSQNYIDSNVVIFSNIFGPILGGDTIPPYSFKQGSKLSNICIEKHFMEHFSSNLDLFANDFVVDLRAGFYDKFYIPRIKTYTYKFLKNGKIVSHWAKFYRGIVVRTMARNNVQTIASLLNLQIQNLQILELIEQKNITTVVCEVLS